MTTTFVEKVRWPVDSAGSLLPRFDKYGFVRRLVEIDAAIKALFAAGEPGAWYNPSDIAVASGTLLGSELITNGDLSAGTTGWTPFDSEAEGTLASISVVNGRLRVTNSQSFQGWCYQYITGLTVGKTYRIEVDAYVGTAPVKIEFYNFYSQPTAATNVTSSAVSGKLVLNAVATNTGMQLKLYVGSSISGQYAEYDNITVKEATTTYSGGTLFQDAAGTIPVTAVEQPVGLMLDKSKGLVLGPELVTNGDFSNGTTGWAYTVSGTSTALISGGQATLTKGSSYCFITQAGVLTAGKVYSVTLDVVSTTGVGAVVNNSGIPYATFATSGTKTFKFRHSDGATNVLYLEAQSGTVVFDNISVRELPGNHATQTTSTSRPVLSARVNLLTKTEQFDDAAWTNILNSVWPNYSVISANAGQAPDGTYTADAFFDTAGQTGNCQRSNGDYVGATYSLANPLTVSCYVKSISHRYFNLIAANDASSGGVTVDLQTGGVTGSGGIVAGTGFAISVGDGWYRVGFQVSSASTGNTSIAGIKVGLRDNPDYTFTASRFQVYQYAQQGTGVLVWGASLTPANQASLPYQRVNTATDYDTAGFPHYLRFDGVDDFLVTNSINFTATDKMFVSAGVRKLSEAGFNMIAELSAFDANPGIFYLGAPTVSRYDFASSGTLIRYATSSSAFPVPITNVLTGIGNISGDQAILRVNGAQAASSTGDQGTGNYGNYPLYIGRRGGTSLPFNGHLYSLIVRGAQSTDQQIIDAERYVNDKTRAY